MWNWNKDIIFGKLILVMPVTNLIGKRFYVSNAVIINTFVEEIKRKLVGRQRKSDKANMQCRKMSVCKGVWLLPCDAYHEVYVFNAW